MRHQLHPVSSMKITSVVRTATPVLAAFASLITLSAQTGKPWPPGLQPITESTAPLSPADEMKTFYMAPGYRVELVASEPLVQDAVAMDWDPDGRLWVVEMPGYMNDIQAV